MNLIAKNNTFENENLREKVKSLILSISNDFLSLVGDDVIIQDNYSNWEIQENHIGKYPPNHPSAIFAFRITLKEDYSKSKKDEILEIFRSAVTTFTIGRNLALKDIKNEDFASAMERLIIISEPIGFLKSKKSLFKIKGYFDQERLNKQKAANAKYPHKNRKLELILHCAKQHKNKYRSLSKLLEFIEEECEKNIIEVIGTNGIAWEPGNFSTMVKKMCKSDPFFNDELKSLLLK